MNSYAKLAMAAAALLVVAVVGINLAPGPNPAVQASPTGSPLASPESTASVLPSQAGAPQLPVEFTGTIACGLPVRNPTEETLDVGDDGTVVTRNRDGAWRQTVTMSDPRLEGAVYHTYEADRYTMPGSESGPVLWAATRRIVNDSGAWETTSYGGSYGEDNPIGDTSTEVWLGEGAFAGLVAIMKGTPIEGTCDLDVRGIVFHGAPVPEPYVAE